MRKYIIFIILIILIYLIKKKNNLHINNYYLKNKLLIVPKIKIKSGNDLLNLLKIKKPVVITEGLFENAKKLSKLWTDKYLSNKVTMKLKVERSKTGKWIDTFDSMYMTMKDYIRHYKNKKNPIYYAGESVPEELKKDIPKFINFDTIINNNYYLYNFCIWFGFNKISTFHQDASDNFLYLASGKKKVFMINSIYNRNNYDYLKYINLKNNKHVNDPKFKDINLYSCDLNQGETLFIPFLWWHYVITPERAIGINYWFNLNM